MENVILDNISNISQTNMSKYMLSVMYDRAIPDIRDGNKPVQRCILYASWKNGYFPNKEFVKCAKIVGDVIGNYHSHGKIHD